MRLLVTRPRPDALKLQGELEELGHEVVVEPLLGVVFERPTDLDFDDVQAVVVTSRNGLRALAAHSMLAEARSRPLFAVGPGTAELARDMAFESVLEGEGDASGLVPLIAANARPADGVLLHLAGDRVDPAFKAKLEHRGFRVKVAIVYRTVDAERLSGTTVSRIRAGDLDGVILMSPRTATVYSALIARHGLVATSDRLEHFCLSEAVVRSLGTARPPRVSIARRPNSKELLALVSEVAAHCS